MTFDPRLRPAAHFTPRRNWLNDPNGLVWHDGEYHLFFQYNPEGTGWGNMSWGHAISPDLMSWTELPVALPYTETEHVFSGCVVVDHDNTSGLGSGQRPPMVAVYTSCDRADGMQRQALASSDDRGRTWQRYAGNPVLDIGASEFRDPKVFRHDDAWVMVVSLADKRMVRLYRSTDLVSWEPLSDFGPAGSVEGIWECPDLFPLPVDGDPARTAWVLLVSVQTGHPAGGSGMQYFVGDFDGIAFTPSGEARWLDHGADFYAAVSYADAPGDQRVIQAWMSNWAYARQVPAAEFRGSMTLPRRLSLRHRGGELHLVQHPVAAAVAGEAAHPSFLVEGVTVEGRLPVPGRHRTARAAVELEPGSARRVGVELRAGGSERTLLVVDPAAGTISLDRTESGDVGFDPGFAAVHTANLRPGDGVIRLEIYVDVASVEVFAGAGEVVLTDLVFPSPESTGIAVFTEGGTAVLRSLEITPLA